MYFAILDFGSTRKSEIILAVSDELRVGEHIVERSLGFDRLMSAVRK